MKTVTPSEAVSPKHSVSEASASSAVSSNTPVDRSGNPMSTEGVNIDYGMMHCVTSAPGKFDFGFMEKNTAETPVETPVHAQGTYPITEGKETANAKPTHAPGTYA